MFFHLILAIENDDDRDFMIRLYSDHIGLMHYVAHSLVNNHADVEDIVNDVIEKLVIKVNKLRKLDYEVIPSYITVSVKRACYNYFKHKKVESKHIALYIYDELHKFDPQSKDDTEKEFIMKLDALQLRDVIAKLPVKYKNVLEFKYLLELSDDEIGDLLGIKKNSVREYLTRARRCAYDIIMEQDYEYDK